MNLLKKFLFFAFIILPIREDLFSQDSPCLLPVQVSSLTKIKLTPIGNFGQIRKARPGVPGHLHTGIDITRPNGNYYDEPIFPLAPGRVISLRDDGPFAQIIIEHKLDGLPHFWSVYEHIAEIAVTLGAQVTIGEPLARFMNRCELEKYGWQFDHFHLEVLKIKPRAIQPAAKLPHYLFQSFNLECYSREELTHYYYDPLEFLGNYLHIDKINNEENDRSAWPPHHSNSLNQ
jgi:Peptidase family M23